ncbi:leucine rich repeat containing protein BspA family protein, partial [Entamoeba invadens IP1]
MQLDSYSLLIVSRFLMSAQDYINVISVCHKFGETLDKLHYNPLPITFVTSRLFPNIETQHLYTKSDI